MRQRWLWLGVVVVAASLVGGGYVGTLSSDDVPSVQPPADSLVSPTDRGGAVWPYTSPSQSTTDRTLAINVVVLGEPERTRRILEDRSSANWSSIDDEGNVTGSPWVPARGAARYTYVATGDGTGRWVRSSYQLGVGTYLGSRTHVRAYPAPAGNWTAMQAHTEYWDWFRLRHTVTGVTTGARFLERDLRDEAVVASVAREYHGFTGGGSDGWMTVIDVVPASAALLAIAVPMARRRDRLVDAALPVALAALVLGVRTAGVAAEGLFPATDPKLFAGLLYPVLAGGPPLAVGLLARERPATRVALLAAGGFGAGLVLDLGAVGVQMVSVRLALHRLALVVALGLLAYGAARGERRTVAVGLGAWIAALVAALLGVV